MPPSKFAFICTRGIKFYRQSIIIASIAASIAATTTTGAAFFAFVPVTPRKHPMAGSLIMPITGVYRHRAGLIDAAILHATPDTTNLEVLSLSSCFDRVI